MDIRFNKCQRRQIRKQLRCFHGKEHVDLYRVFKAIAYLVYTGCQWQMLPTYYPRPTTVYYHFRKWSESRNLILFLHRLVKARRKKTGRRGEPAVTVVDSQSVRSAYPQSQKSGTHQFIPISGRRVVERTNASLDNFRRLCRNYERYLSTAHAMALVNFKTSNQESQLRVWSPTRYFG